LRQQTPDSTAVSMSRFRFAQNRVAANSAVKLCQL
jgi:hypothetical protein